MSHPNADTRIEDENDGMACQRHDLKRLPSDYDRCPLCVEEERIEARLEH